MAEKVQHTRTKQYLHTRYKVLEISYAPSLASSDIRLFGSGTAFSCAETNIAISHAWSIHWRMKSL